MARAATKGITTPRGFRAAGGTCGIKESGQPDLAMIVADQPCAAAGMFTKNKVQGAPVRLARRHLRNGMAQAIVCNSGHANVCAGQQGLSDARTMCNLVATGIGAKTTDVLPCSTGLIGVPLPMNKIKRGIATLLSCLERGVSVNVATARAIMTTDLVPKTTHVSFELERGQRVHIAGIAKGSGMIAPNLATMLCFLTTDGAISSELLGQALRRAVDHSFNRISVDHDTSTSDSVLILASGAARHDKISRSGKAFKAFTNALTRVCDDLAFKLVEDGEGATRVFRVVVNQARSQRDADRVGHTVVGSPLVKTAIHGADPNWGRILMAIGRSGTAVDPRRLSLRIGDEWVFKKGTPILTDARRTRKLIRIMQRKYVVFTLDLGMGSASAQWLGCDLSQQYVTINADYRT